jgi:hypothetical protein
MKKLFDINVVMKEEHLQLATITYPQLTALPKGFHFVKQKGYKNCYCGFSANGNLILDVFRCAKKDQEGIALALLNAKLRWTKMTWGKPCRKADYERTIS